MRGKLPAMAGRSLIALGFLAMAAGCVAFIRLWLVYQEYAQVDAGVLVVSLFTYAMYLLAAMGAFQFSVGGVACLLCGPGSAFRAMAWSVFAFQTAVVLLFLMLGLYG